VTSLSRPGLRRVAAALATLLASGPALAGEPVSVVVRYRSVYFQIEPRIPAGRWSETAALRLRLDGRGGVAIEALTDLSSPTATRVVRRDGETVDFGSYRASYRVEGSERVTFRSDYPGFTLTRDVRIAAGGCTLTVDYDGHGNAEVTMPLPDGRIGRFRRIVAHEATCRIEGTDEARSTLSAGCRFEWDEAAQLFHMRVARSAVCIGRFARNLVDPTARLAIAPAHGRVDSVDRNALRYTPAADHLGPDRFEVDVTGRAPNGPRRVRRVVEVTVLP
jgi:hypothetical protein